jgi:hypothetical protein
MTERKVSSERVSEYFVEQVAKEIAKHTYARCLPHMTDCEDWDAMDEADRKIYRSAASAALSQASSVIAGLRNERITAERVAFDAYGKLQAAEARISSLEEENKRLRGSLGSACEHIEQLSELLKIIKNHWIDYDHVFSISVHEADEFLASRQALEQTNG